MVCNVCRTKYIQSDANKILSFGYQSAAWNPSSRGTRKTLYWSLLQYPTKWTPKQFYKTIITLVKKQDFDSIQLLKPHSKQLLDFFGREKLLIRLLRNDPTCAFAWIDGHPNSEIISPIDLLEHCRTHQHYEEFLIVLLEHYDFLSFPRLTYFVQFILDVRMKNLINIGHIFLDSPFDFSERKIDILQLLMSRKPHRQDEIKEMYISQLYRSGYADVDYRMPWPMPLCQVAVICCIEEGRCEMLRKLLKDVSKNHYFETVFLKEIGKAVSISRDKEGVMQVFLDEYRPDHWKREWDSKLKRSFKKALRSVKSKNDMSEN